MYSRIGLLLWCIFLNAQMCCFAFTQDTSPEAIRSGALRQLGLLEACSAFRVNADVEVPLSKGEVWAEVRNSSFWIEREAYGGKNEAERLVAKNFHQKLMDAAGGTGRRIDAFNASKFFNYDPAKSELSIEKKPIAHPSAIAYCLYPESWICFNMSYNPEFMRFSHLLGRDDVHGAWRAQERVMRFTQQADSGIDSWKERWIDVDPANGFTVVRYFFGGVKMGSWSGEFKWREMNSVWFVEQGTIKFEGNPTCQWKIKEFSMDAKTIRGSFKIEEESIPFGTRVKETDGKKVTNRFVGGEKGKLEYDLRRTALNNLQVKK